MTRILSIATATLLAVICVDARAQTAPPPAPQSGGMQMPMGQMMQNMPEQCRAAMQNMPQDCMGAMHQMMQRGAAADPHAGHGAAQLSDASKAYLEAMDKMHGPMMEGARAPDADVAFIKGMIPHHQGAIDMARIVMRYGKDEQTRKLANDVIREQEREIAEMQAWLKKHGH